MNNAKAIRFAALSGLILSSLSSHGKNLSNPTEHIQPPEEKNIFQRGTYSFYLDNDLFAGTDGNYTNGARISWVSDSYDTPRLPRLHKFLSAGSRMLDSHWKRFSDYVDTPDVQYQFGFAISQLMFTPEDQSNTPPPGERPYAGVLGFGTSVHRITNRSIDSFELSLGIIGPSALAENAQDFIHDIRNLDEFNGWDNQIPDEFIFNLDYSHKTRYNLIDSDIKLEGISETNLSLGTYVTEASYGWNFRLGMHLDNVYYDPRLTTTSNTLWWGEEQKQEHWSAYLTGGVKATYVFHNVTLDGPVFRDFETGVDKEDFIGEAYCGFGVRRGGFSFSYIYTFRSKEFETQDGSHTFGTVGMTYSY